MGGVTYSNDATGNRTSGVLKVAYTYDAWGKPLTTTGSMASTLGQANPLRYRGYVYDNETGLYYLGSRYYDPGVGRFINADDVSLLGINNTFNAFNLFAYCLNNPIRYLDIDGGFAGAIIGSLFGGLIGGITALARGESFWEGVVSGAVEGAFAGGSVDLALSVLTTGGVTGVVFAGLISFGGGFAGNYFGEETESLIETGEWKDMDKDMFQRCTIAGVNNTASMVFTATYNYAVTGTVKPDIPMFRPCLHDVIYSFSATHFALFETVKLLVD